MATPTVFNFPVDTKRMMRAIDTPDDIGAVVRIHFELDRALEHVINAMVPRAKILTHRFMSQRIMFLSALGLPPARVEPARVINAIRNDFAHREKETLEAKDIKSLEVAIVGLLRKNIPTHFALYNKKDDEVRREWRYGEMTLKEQFCLLGFFAVSGVATIENDFKVSFVETNQTGLA